MNARALLITLCLMSCWPAVAAPASRPNIVFVLIDDLRYDTFGFMGHPFVETPHIDALAEGGLQFSNAFVTTSLCSPSRASFLTGQFMHHHGVIDNAEQMSKELVTFPQRLQQADYQTAFIGKWHMGGSSDAPRPGFDHWVSFRGQGSYAPDGQSLNINGQQVRRQKYMTDELTDYAVRWLANQNDQHPFLLYLSHKGVHGLYDPAPRHRGRYQNRSFDPPASMADTDQNHAGKPMWVHDQRNSWHGVEFPYHGRANESIAEMYKHYCEMILSIDDSVGKIVQSLRDREMLQNTLIIFTSDGGHLWGEHGLIDKRCAYEESIRIPLLATCPALIPPQSECQAIVANIDVAPTLLELAGLPHSENIDGHSFARLLRDPTASHPWRDSLLYEYYWEPSFPQTPTTFALRENQYKFIQYHGIWDSDELYNIADDPHEMHNLIHDPAHRQRVDDFRKQLYQQLQATDGLTMPIGFKRNEGANLRKPDGSKRAPFPARMINE